MIKIERGVVVEIKNQRKGMQEVLVNINGQIEKAINYPDLTGYVDRGDHVSLNTTAVDLNLGTGGYHFVMANLNVPRHDAMGKGHIMKMRYSPCQVKCLSVEEQDSPYHENIKNFESLDGMPVVVATLHSMLPAIVAALRQQCGERISIAYIMTDGAALPLALSHMVSDLKQKGWIDHTITVGHAFGGDLEAVNCYTGLIAAKEVFHADVAVVAMGPGIVGTGTTFGFTGIEQGENINAVSILGGIPIAVIRMSFADARKRHRGISHHSLTVLERIVLREAIVPIPFLIEEKMSFIKKQLLDHHIGEIHKIIMENGENALEFLHQNEVKVKTMGRTINEDRAFFLAAGAAGNVAAHLVRNQWSLD